MKYVNVTFIYKANTNFLSERLSLYSLKVVKNLMMISHLEEGEETVVR